MFYKILMTILGSIAIILGLLEQPSQLSYTIWVLIALMNVWRAD